MDALRYLIPSHLSRRATARVVIAALLARGARPLVFTRTSAEASVLSSAFGLLLLDPAWPVERTLTQIHPDEPPRGLVATLGAITGWRASWATDVLFVDIPTRVELAQGESRAAHVGRSEALLVGIVHVPGDPASRLLRA